MDFAEVAFIKRCKVVEQRIMEERLQCDGEFMSEEDMDREKMDALHVSRHARP